MPEPVSFPKGELAKQLGKISILGALSQGQLRKLANWAEVVAFDKGELVVKRGERGDGVYLILSGSVDVRRGERKIAHLGEGQIFGEMSLFDDEPRSADVVTSAPSKLAVLQKWEFWGFAASQPGVVLNILGEMSRRLRATDEALAD